MTTLYVREKFETRESCWKHVDRRHQRRIPMKSHTSRLKIFDSESMSERTPQASDVRATERISRDSKRYFQTKRFRQLKTSVQNVVSNYDQRNLWTFMEQWLEPVEIVNARSHHRTSKKHLHLAPHRLA